MPAITEQGCLGGDLADAGNHHERECEMEKSGLAVLDMLGKILGDGKQQKAMRAPEEERAGVEHQAAEDVDLFGCHGLTVKLVVPFDL
ncbi:hypothetical protein [Agrobacterium vitis]|uniref:hypothetical protein n=1 Tax=Agrobacterium vitis TaxID=373 RepID=UPI0012E83FDB|nr:hypothetical protein [Agrobacterium vitis]MVA28153.1 hypothetical protein [Agrobacterium vitis]